MTVYALHTLTDRQCSRTPPGPDPRGYSKSPHSAAPAPLGGLLAACGRVHTAHGGPQTREQGSMSPDVTRLRRWVGGPCPAGVACAVTARATQTHGPAVGSRTGRDHKPVGSSVELPVRHVLTHPRRRGSAPRVQKALPGNKHTAASARRRATGPVERSGCTSGLTTWATGVPSLPRKSRPRLSSTNQEGAGLSPAHAPYASPRACRPPAPCSPRCVLAEGGTLLSSSEPQARPRGRTR